jgi:hypothetical protein
MRIKVTYGFQTGVPVDIHIDLTHELRVIAWLMVRFKGWGGEEPIEFIKAAEDVVSGLDPDIP